MASYFLKTKITHLMENNILLKGIIFTWLFIMCFMDRFNPSPLQIRLIIWGINGLLFTVWFSKNISQNLGFVPFREKSIALVLYLFLFWACISIFLSSKPAYGISQIGHFFIAFLDTYIFYDFLSRGKKNVHFFFKVITFLVLFMSFWVVIESIQKLSMGEKLFKNIYAGFGNQNSLGYFLFLFLPLMFSYYFIHSSFYGKYRVWRILLLILIGYTFFLSFSRSAWNGFFFALFFLLAKKNKAWGKGISILIIITSISIYLFIGGFYQTTWEKMLAERFTWRLYWDIIPDNPLFGQGLGTGLPNNRGFHAHNSYLEDAVEMGIPSVIFVLAFYIIFLYTSCQTEKKIRDPQLRAILLGSTATYFGHLIYNLTDILGILVRFHPVSVSLLPYIFIALPLALSNFEQ